MSIDITNADTGAALEGQVVLTQTAPSVTRPIAVTNNHTARITSLKLYVVNDPALPGNRSVTVNSVTVTGTDEATATEVLTEPLEVGASVTGTDTLSVDPAAFKEGYDLASLHFIASPEV